MQSWQMFAQDLSRQSFAGKAMLFGLAIGLKQQSQNATVNMVLMSRECFNGFNLIKEKIFLNLAKTKTGGAQRGASDKT